jgi:DNA-binding XRE family transcriptional regulator
MVQFITTPKGEEMALLPRVEYERLAALAEDVFDRRCAEEIMTEVKAGREEVFPAAMVNQLLDGVNPVKLFRQHRGITQRDLAASVGINPVYLSQIERGARAGSLETMKALAKALFVDLDMLTG